MKRIVWTILFACSTLAMAAQESILVRSQGARPTISDFAQAFLSAYEYDENEDDLDEARNAAKNAWINYQNGVAPTEDRTLTVDQNNGYVAIELRYDIYLTRIEMCYWNEADGKHRLFAYNVRCFTDGKYDMGQFDGLTFYRYDNATKRMTLCDSPGFNQEYRTEDGAYVSYALPRSGKDITAKKWYDDGRTKEWKLKWNGRRFGK